MTELVQEVTAEGTRVTMAEVLDWCWASGVDKDAVEAGLVEQIVLQKNPVQESGVPWAS